MSVRVRFAPSPTGFLHIGGARTALFNWMFARKHGGKFVLRIEDTDQKRFVRGATEAIIDGLRWLGLDWDEGPDVGGPYAPYIQTQRAALYREWAQWLLDHDHAYKCFCPPEELEEMRKEQIAKKLMLGYNGRCRRLTTEQVAEKEVSGIKYVVRFKMPLEGKTIIPDVIRGDIVYDNTQITDAILLKSDGLPTYHLANVVDDHFMEISHILRADEWISTSPLHINLYAAFNWQHPIYAHLPLILNPSGKGKLSKRNQRFNDEGQEVLVRVEEFREAGLLPEAVLNFLANVGWSFGDDREKFTLAEAIPRISLENIIPAPSRLPYSKLDWLNGQYIQQMEVIDLAKAVKPFLDAANLEVSSDALLAIAPSMSTRLKRLTEAVHFLRFLSDDLPLTFSVGDLTHEYLPQGAALGGFRQTRDFIAIVEPYSLENISTGVAKIAESATTNKKAGPFLGKLRLAITNQQVSPPVYESMLALGRARVLARLDEVISRLQYSDPT